MFSVGKAEIDSALELELTDRPIASLGATEPFRSPTLIVIAMMISGYAAGTKIQLCGYLTARYAGLRNYGAIFGFMTSMIALASGLGPLLAGMSYDHYGSYGPLLIAGAVVSVISGLLIFSLGKYPDWSMPASSD